jgi:hypothetical protein
MLSRSKRLTRDDSGSQSSRVAHKKQEKSECDISVCEKERDRREEFLIEFSAL